MKHWERKIDNIVYDFIIGSNKEENQYLINSSEPVDLWFHISDCPSCHVICKINHITKVSNKHFNKIIKQGAVCCKSHSKYKNLKDVNITYARIEHLQNTDKVGSVIVNNGKNITI